MADISDRQDHQAPTCELDVLDRVGGGDGYAACLINGILTGEAPAKAVKPGSA
jgi:2-dehydro-3-deoxygluconokinase